MRVVAIAGITAILGFIYFASEGLNGLLLGDVATERQSQLARSDAAGPSLKPAHDVGAQAGSEDADLVHVRAAHATRDGDKTKFDIRLSRGLTAEVFTLPDPYRVVIDMPEVVFSLPDRTGQSGAGLVKAFRYGLFAEGQGRIVLDITGPVRIDRARMETVGDGVNFEILLSSITKREFGAGTGGGSDSTPTAAKPPVAKMPSVARVPASKPVIMIDPGHGGVDPGAVSTSNLLEKNVVLAVGKALRTALRTSGLFEVEMTRSRDVFVSLDRRVQRSQQRNADLFVSLHADSVAEQAAAHSIRGATVYTLSANASDEQARKMAEKENASDLLAGISSRGKIAAAGDVTSILIDLLQREKANFSTDLSKVLVRKMRASITLARIPERSAAFKVLKQTHAPAVLIELGYMSHPKEERLMRTAEWQKKVAAAIAGAIKTYFAKRSALRGGE